MRRWKGYSIFVGVVVLVLPALVYGQGYGGLDDDEFAPQNQHQQQNQFSQNQPQQQNQFPPNQQISSLPQYDSVEQQQPFQTPPQNLQQQSVSGAQNNPWWQGQNQAFQRPPGHPGVEQLSPNPGQAPQVAAPQVITPQVTASQQQPPHKFNYNVPPPPNPNYNAYGTSGQLAPPAQQLNNLPPVAPQQQPAAFNNPIVPSAQPNQPLQAIQYDNPPTPQEPSVAPPSQGGSGWNAPQQPPQQPYQSQVAPQQTYQPQASLQQSFQPQAAQQQPYQPQAVQQLPYQPQAPIPAPPQQNYQPPPLNPIQFPQQNYQPQLQQPQQSIPLPNQGYRPPPLQAQENQLPYVPVRQTNQLPPVQPNTFIPPIQQQAPARQTPPQYQPIRPNPFNPPQPQSQPSKPYQSPLPQQPRPTNQYNPRPTPQQQPREPLQTPRPTQKPREPYTPPQTPRPIPQQQPREPYKPPQIPRVTPQQPREPYTPPQVVRPRPQPQVQQPRPNPPQTQVQPQRQTALVSQAPAVPFPGCPAAMLCVADEYCNAIGLIEESPVQFSAADRLHRVALMQCSEPMSGIVGVCCRDPNYKDQWTTAQGAKQDTVKGQSQGQKSPFFQPQQPPLSNHLASAGGSNHYGQSGSGDSGNNNYGWTHTHNGVQCNSNILDGFGSSSNKSAAQVNPAPKSISTSSSSLPSASTESKQTLQVLELCSFDELCISMSQCHSLNPQFMEKTGLNPSKLKNRNNLTASEPVKVKQCKYERSGMHYLCCKKPVEIIVETTTPTAFRQSSSTARFPSRHISGTISTSKPSSTFTSQFSSKPTAHNFPTTNTTPPPPLAFTSFFLPSTTPSTLVTGVGLRFHSGLHTQRQKELNDKKPNPYGENEQPILLNSPTENTAAKPFAFSSAPTHSFRFTTTSTTPAPATPNSKISGGGSNSGFRFLTTAAPSRSFTSGTSQSISTFARVLGSTRTYTPTTTPTPLPSTTSFSSRNLNSPFKSSSFSLRPSTPISSSSPSPSTIITTNIGTETIPPTTTEGKVDISKIPSAVPLRKELKQDPPIGFIFKGDDLFIPEIKTPSQNYLLPTNNFEERIFPTDPPLEPETDHQSNSGNNFLEGTTIYSILDDVNNSHEHL